MILLRWKLIRKDGVSALEIVEQSLLRLLLSYECNFVPKIIRYGNNGIFLLREYLGMDDAKKGSIVRMNFLVSTMTAFEEVEDEEC